MGSLRRSVSDATTVSFSSRRSSASARSNARASASVSADGNDSDSLGTPSVGPRPSSSGESIGVRSHGVLSSDRGDPRSPTPPGERDDSASSATSARTDEAPGSSAKDAGAGSSYRGVSEWMDAVVARAKEARAREGWTSDRGPIDGAASAASLAAAAKSAAGAEAGSSLDAPRGGSPSTPTEGSASSARGGAARRRAVSPPDHGFARDGGSGTVTTDAEEAFFSRDFPAAAPSPPTPAPALEDEDIELFTVEELIRAVRTQRAKIASLVTKHESMRAALERTEATRAETAAALARSRAREESAEAELRRSAERCAEIDAGRRSARAALAEMASQNARLVSAFSAKKEEARTLRGEVLDAKRGMDEKQSARESTLDAELRDALAEAERLRETVRRRDAELTRADASAQSAKAEARAARREAEKLRDASAEAANAMRREEQLAARVARKELDVERARFAAERERWTSERKRWAAEIAAVRDAAARGTRAGRPAGGEDDAPAAARGQGQQHAANANANGTAAANAPFRDPRPDGSRSQPASPRRGAGDSRSDRARARPHPRSAPASPAKKEKEKSRETSSPGPKASPRERAEYQKVRGNNEFHAKRYDAALSRYGAGLRCAFDDDALRAVLHANRAAASQALRRYCDAVMDCCASHLLDPGYLRALQRRADAYLSMGDWPSAVKDLEVLTPKMGSECAAKLEEARRKARRGQSADHYAVLGVGKRASAAEVKQAYRQLALKHHPDKAPKPELRETAEALFKHVARAYAVLSDENERRKYDADVALAKFTRNA